MCDERERVDMVKGCKWVDGMMKNVPYEVIDAFN